MSTVWKYELSFERPELRILMPRDAEILYFGNQHEVPCLWALVDTEAASLLRRFTIRGTGHPHAEGKYIGTALFDNGNLVFHCFEKEL